MFDVDGDLQWKGRLVMGRQLERTWAGCRSLEQGDRTGADVRERDLSWARAQSVHSKGTDTGAGEWMDALVGAHGIFLISCFLDETGSRVIR